MTYYRHDNQKKKKPTNKDKKMAIRTLTGHLTATNKRHITAMFDENRLDAKINRLTYRIEDGTYTVKISHNESDDYGKMRERTNTATFKII